ncbi:unnamed protein product [Gongylonema pulchrum]|uniref:Uncharacterized protein n=1 Tax=Gongylonema pulchrum TaxID=637853 RepID=A0A183EW58_9BILA|nr:unnamed protein product [Gongylonema pulchrum]
MLSVIPLHDWPKHLEVQSICGNTLPTPIGASDEALFPKLAYSKKQSCALKPKQAIAKAMISQQNNRTINQCCFAALTNKFFAFF